MGDRFEVLFVCTGNIFRSLSAEYLLKQLLREKKDSRIRVSSAGIIAHVEPPHEELRRQLRNRGISISKHKQRKLTKKIFDKADLVIAMSTNHQESIRKLYGVRVPLFNELAYGKKVGVLDIGEKRGQLHFENKKLPAKKVVRHIQKTVRHLEKGMPALYRYLEERYFLFTSFVEQNMRHLNGVPVELLYQTKNTAAFMSEDIPATQDGHVLVIPKKRYETLEEIPQPILGELIETVAFVGKALMKTHQGYNILLNNGEAAGQWEHHVHFHLIPRDRRDHIQIERWKKRKKTTKEAFKEMNDRLLAMIKEVRKD